MKLVGFEPIFKIMFKQPKWRNSLKNVNLNQRDFFLHFKLPKRIPLSSPNCLTNPKALHRRLFSPVDGYRHQDFINILEKNTRRLSGTEIWKIKNLANSHRKSFQPSSPVRSTVPLIFHQKHDKMQSTSTKNMVPLFGKNSRALVWKSEHLALFVIDCWAFFFCLRFLQSVPALVH